jgi:hypothetical protein
VRRPTATPTTVEAHPILVRPHPTVQTHVVKPVRQKRPVHKNRMVQKNHVAPKVESKSATREPNDSGGAVLGVRTAATPRTRTSTDFQSLLIATMLGLAIICLGIAAIPAVYVPWRPVAYFIAERHVDMAIAGLGCLVLAGFLMLVAGGV